MLVEITGKRALFSRPGLRAERYSYEVPTVSALEGILKCIYWKPEMQYLIKKIYVLNKPKFETITTNSLIRKGVYRLGKERGYGSHDTTPRTMKILKDVHYIIDVSVETTETGTAPDDCREKHVGIFKRRLERGQNYKEPCLGVREFPCDVRFFPKDAAIPVSENHGTKKLGRMLRNITYHNGKAVPVFFSPVMRDGVIDVNESLKGPCKEGWLFQELVGYYERMQERYHFPVFGYSNAKIYYEAVINRDGKMVKFAPLSLTEKGKVAPVFLAVPEAVIRTSNPCPNFLWDNADYVLGMGTDGTLRKKLFLDKIKDVMGDLKQEETDAVIQFLMGSKPEDYMGLLEPYLTVTKGVKNLKGNIVFRMEGKERFVHDCPEVKKRWESYFYKNLTGKKIDCLITGEEDYLTEIHPLIKGVAGSSGMGKLVSIDGEATAFECYGMKQMENSPFGRRTAHKYATVLNWMLANLDHKVDVNNESFIFWTEHDNEALLRNIRTILGRKPEEDAPAEEIPDGEKFYIAGLKASTKGRLYVAHYQEFVYGNSANDMKEFLSEISKCYRGSRLRPCYEIIEKWEEKSVEQKEKGHAYLLGSLQAYIEKAQKDAVTSTRKQGTPTIADRYIKRASESPASIFPRQLSMAQKYTTKVDYGMKKRITLTLLELNRFEEPFPERLTAKERCEFFIGYYETNHSFFIKKVEKKGGQRS